MKPQQSIPLAFYRSLQEYKPKHGDYVVWSKWFSTWHGFVSDYDIKEDSVSVIFSGIPLLLLTMSESEQKKETRKIPLANIVSSTSGSYAILSISEQGAVWYV
jgi:hypothetical protein